VSLESKLKADYDMFIFSQVWPPVSCYDWKQKSPSHKCNMPPFEEWSIHGLWPTKKHTLGPFYCNSSLPFNYDALDSLKAQLEVKWIDVHKGSKPHEFWRHEWEKHGTCSVDIENINTEKKYFQKALDLHDKYNLKDVLDKANILVNQKYKLQDYLDGLQKVLKKTAFVGCIESGKKDETFVSELRICLDKQFELMNCNDISEYPSNCNHKKLITYPESVPNFNNMPTVVQV
ncbi:hypothetical protein QAD02_012543, partial [Eretmocerus hayati]